MRVSPIGNRFRQSPIPKSRFCEHLSDANDTSSPCRQRIYVICPHCQRSLCLYHINEHQVIIRSLFDSLVNRLNEYRYELTVKLVIPTDSQILVNNCLDEFQKVIIPYVQRTCCRNDVKQEDVNRLESFSKRMQMVVQNIQSNGDEKQVKQSRSTEEGENTTSNKRSRTDSDSAINLLR